MLFAGSGAGRVEGVASGELLKAFANGPTFRMESNGANPNNAAEVGTGRGVASTTPPVVVLLAWAAVGLPLAWGVYKTLINVSKFFA